MEVLPKTKPMVPLGDKTFSSIRKGLSPPVNLKTPEPFPTPIYGKSINGTFTCKFVIVDFLSPITYKMERMSSGPHRAKFSQFPSGDKLNKNFKVKFAFTLKFK